MSAALRTPLFSICHTSARPDKWRAVYDDWMEKAVHPEQVEYVLCIDPRWGFSLDPAQYETALDNIIVEQNTGRRCYVDGVNIAAAASSGSILIVNADDQFACEAWDEALSGEVCGVQVDVFAGTEKRFLDESFVIDVNTGTPAESAYKVCQMPILSRARYEAQGGEVFYHGYESMCADNDFREWAVKDGVLIDAYHLYFLHLHPLYSADGKWKSPDPREWDEAYQVQNRTEAYQQGAALLERRRAAGFIPLAEKRSIVLCLPGERFEGPFFDAILDLQAHLLLNMDFMIARRRHYTSNPAITRGDIANVLAAMNPKPDLCLWIDDDNPLSVLTFNRLLAGLDGHPEVDGVAGWCWIHTEKKTGFMVSCGDWSPDYLHWDPFPNWFANSQGLKSFSVGGMPCILMRYSALEKAGPGAFIPIIDSRFEHGMSGEDIAFFWRAEQGGARFFVDPQCRVPHLKYVEVEPVFPSEGKAPVKIASMLRVKNEGRWIKRCIDSIRELSGDLIFVMEDGSTDDTRAICEAAGVVVLDSPFAGMGLNEERDKDWLLQEVIARCHPDWIFMPDGDEELEPGGCEKLRRAAESNPPCDCFALRFLYLWDSVDHIRVDGMYSRLQRQSFFRVDSNFHFSSIYTEDQTKNQNHVGLHCSNAPGLGGRVMGINCALLHYGYLHRQDRIQKYRWLLTIDPHNEMEDFYRHCVQGDIPEVPADAVLKHGGPLKLTKLPPHLRPKFDVVPGPRPLVDSWATPAETGGLVYTGI